MTSHRPVPGPLPPGAVLPPMHVGSNQQASARPAASQDAPSRRQGGRPLGSQPKQSNRVTNAKGDGHLRSGNRFVTINAFVDITMRELSDRAALAWLVLWRDTKPNGLARTAVADLARRMGCSLSKAKRALAELRKKNLLDVPTRGGLGRGPSSYRLADSRTAAGGELGLRSEPSTGSK